MRSSRFLHVTACLLSTIAAVSLTGCGGLSTPSDPRSPGPPPPATFPHFGHVVVVMEENHSYSEIIGNPDMPYLNSLAKQYGLSTNYFANTHPSIGNYFMLSTGKIITNDDTFSGSVSDDNIVRELLAAGKTWKSYAESIPNPGYTGGDSYPYAERHNILSYFTDVRNSTTQVQNLTSFSQFQRDLDGGTLPNFSYVVPNLLDDGHDGPLNLADGWLQQYIGP
ncbi:MAG: alkaline phosphatase family protein, partial [Acidobacteriota bacterium]|nr:alkaline phosphatase family protein [Acidobacteriota bacterium]